MAASCPYKFSLGSNNYQVLPLATRELLPHVLESIHKICLLSTQHLLVKGSKKQQRRWDYSNVIKGETFLVYVISGVISPCITLPCPFQKGPSFFLHFGQAENIHSTYLKKKNFLICFSPLSPQAEQKEDDEHFANHLQMYVMRPLLRPKNLYYSQNTHPISSKFHLSKWKTYFPQFIDKFFKIEEVEYLIHYVKFNM